MSNATRNFCTNHGEMSFASIAMLDSVMLSTKGAPHHVLSILFAALLQRFEGWAHGSQPLRTVNANGRGPVETRVVVSAETFGNAYVALSEADPYGRMQAMINKADATIGNSTLSVHPDLLGTETMHTCLETIAQATGETLSVDPDTRKVIKSNGKPMMRKGGHRIISTQAGPMLAYNVVGLAYATLSTGATVETDERPMPKAPNAVASFDTAQCEDGSLFAETYAAELAAGCEAVRKAFASLAETYPVVADAMMNPSADMWEARRTAKVWERVEEYVTAA